jgi:ABC-type transport system involved in multi-copper enzyme maturation permease subunit
VKASTHTEVYRKFEGELRARPMRALILARAAVRIAFKRKLPALLFYTPIGIACVIFSFQVYFVFSVKGGEAANTLQGAMMGDAISEILGNTVENIFQFLQQSAKFVLLVMVWYGSGLINEDRRLGANQLYFSRPLRRLDYIAGKFLATAWFGCLALVLPCLIICMVAAISSPDWSFLTEEWETIPQVIVFGLLWVATMSLVVLTVSSITHRRSHAIVGAAGLVYGASTFATVLHHALDDGRASILNLFANMERVGESIFGVTLIRDRVVSTESSLAALGVLWVVCLFILTERVRKLEVVA